MVIMMAERMEVRGKELSLLAKSTTVAIRLQETGLLFASPAAEDSA
jgi:hypothetical protein